MTIHRFFVPAEIIDPEMFLPEDVSHQISQVLRLKTDDQIILLDNSGFEYICALTKVDKKHCAARLIEKRQNKNEPEINVHLFQSLINRDNFELVLQKAVELGVTEITPVQTERSQFNIAWAQEKIERFQRIIKEAAEQSERGKLPILHDAINFDSAIKKSATSGETLIAWEKEGTTSKVSISSTDIKVFIGPEGGFTEEEIDFAKNQKVKTISLGKTILRAETASIALLAKIILN